MYQRYCQEVLHSPLSPVPVIAVVASVHGILTAGYDINEVAGSVLGDPIYFVVWRLHLSTDDNVSRCNRLFLVKSFKSFYTDSRIEPATAPISNFALEEEGVLF